MTSVSGSGSSASTALQLLQQASQVLSAKSQTSSDVSTAPKLAYGSAALSSSARDAIMQIKSLVPGKVVSKSEVASEVYNAGADMTPEEIAAHNEGFMRDMILPKAISREEFEADTLKMLRENYGSVVPKLSQAIADGTYKILRPEEIPELGYVPDTRPIYSGAGLAIGVTGTLKSNGDYELYLKSKGIELAYGDGSLENRNPFVFLFWEKST